MDIARDPRILKRKRQRQVAGGIVGLLLVIALSAALARMEPAAPSVDRSTVLTDTVKRGSIVRQVRGVGTLVPEDTRWIPAVTDGRVDRIVLRPGAEVTAEAVILELSNPQVEQDASAARLAVRSAEATLANLHVQLRNERLTQESTVATVNADYQQAKLDAESKESLAQEKLIGSLELKQSQIKAETLKTRLDIEQRRLASADESIDARTRVQEAAVDAARDLLRLQESRLASLKVPTGICRRTPAGSRRSRATRRTGHQSRARRRPDAAQGGVADCGDVRQRHRSGSAGRRSIPAMASCRAASAGRTRPRRMAACWWTSRSTERAPARRGARSERRWDRFNWSVSTTSSTWRVRRWARTRAPLACSGCGRTRAMPTACR